jgi:hypothetical protein
MISRILYVGSKDKEFMPQLEEAGFGSDFVIDVAHDEATLAELVKNYPYSAVIYDISHQEPQQISDICCALDGIISAEIHGGVALGLFFNNNARIDTEFVDCIIPQGRLSFSTYYYKRPFKSNKDGANPTRIDYSTLANMLTEHFYDFLQSINTPQYKFLLDPDKRYIDLDEIKRAAKDLGSVEKAISLMITQVSGRNESLMSLTVNWPLNGTPLPHDKPWSRIEIALDGKNSGKYFLVCKNTDERGYTRVNDFKPYGEVLYSIYQLGCKLNCPLDTLRGFRDRLFSGKYNLRQ